MTLSLWQLLLYIPACFALNMIPGPNNLLSVHNAARYGLRAACVAGFGRIVAFAIMIALTVVGLAALLATSAAFFWVVKIAGGLYLLWMAWQLWRAPTVDSVISRATSEPAPLWALARQEFLVAAGNPKAILIFTAFLPQFVTPGGDVSLQLMQIGTLFLMLELVAIALYGYLGANLQRLLASARNKQRFNRICGTLLGAAGASVLAATRL